MSLESNCFRLHATIARKDKGLFQVVVSGTLFEVLAQLVYNISNGEEPQQVTITKLEDNTCVEDAVIEEYPESEDEANFLKEKYSRVYKENYLPPSTSIAWPCLKICENEKVVRIIRGYEDNGENK